MKVISNAIFRLFVVFFILIIFSSCNKKRRNDSNPVNTEEIIKESNQNNSKLVQETKIKKTISNEDFLGKIKTTDITNLPYFHKIELLKSLSAKQSTEDSECYRLKKIKTILNKIPENYNFKDTIAFSFPINNFKPFKIQKLKFVKRFKPINDIEILLYCSHVSYEGDGALFILISYDKEKRKILDDKVISVFGYGQNNWSYYSGFYITSDYKIVTVSHTTEESIYDLLLRELKVEKTGLITTKKIKKIDGLEKNNFFENINNQYSFINIIK